MEGSQKTSSTGIRTFWPKDQGGCRLAHLGNTGEHILRGPGCQVSITKQALQQLPAHIGSGGLQNGDHCRGIFFTRPPAPHQPHPLCLPSIPCRTRVVIYALIRVNKMCFLVWCLQMLHLSSLTHCCIRAKSQFLFEADSFLEGMLLKRCSNKLFLAQQEWVVPLLLARPILETYSL